MKRSPVVNPTRLSVLALAALTAGCSMFSSSPSDSTINYQSSSTAATSKPLEVPPDLTQLSRDTRYQQQGGVVSAAATPARPGAATATTAATVVAPQSRGDVRIERDGNQRWLVVPMTPEQLWPQLVAFWKERGFALAIENPEVGIIETQWAENRAKLPQDFIRSTIGRLIEGMYDSGLRDQFHTRIERTATGSEVYITHRGIAEVYVDKFQEITSWQPRPSEPQLEAEFLSRLMASLGPKDVQTARAEVAAAASAPAAPARARAVAGAPSTLEVDEPFDRAWRRVGVALDRSGFTVEDRDRAGGLYFVRYVDPKYAGKEDPNFFEKLFSSTPTAQQSLSRYRVTVKAAGDKTQVTVMAANGTDSAGETGERIVSRLVTELR